MSSRWVLLTLSMACQAAPTPAAGLLARGTSDAALGVVVSDATLSDATPALGEWSLHFSPEGGCENAVVSLINSAHKSVYLMAYGFTEEAVANALIRKHVENLEVIVVLDKSDKTAKRSMAPVLQNAGVPVYIDSRHAIMHDKVVIVDGEWFENGSYNFTDSAEKSNAENCLIEHAPEKAQMYDKNFTVHLGHSNPLVWPPQ